MMSIVNLKMTFPGSWQVSLYVYQIDGLVQERCHSIASAFLAVTHRCVYNVARAREDLLREDAHTLL